MKYIELAFVTIAMVAVLQALGPALRVPMPLLQIAGGALLSFVAHLDALHEQSALIFVMLVPPLLYMEAWLAPKRGLWHKIGPITGLAFGLVAITVAVIGYGAHALLPGLPLAAAFAMAACLAPTDTVAVGTVVQRWRLPAQLAVVLNGESLFNDAVALVAFQVAVSAALGRSTTLAGAAGSLVTLSIGGAVTGSVVAALGWAARRCVKADQPESDAVDTALSFLTPYAAYLAAEKLAVSGVLAVVAAGLVAGVIDRGILGPATRLRGKAVWTTACLILNGSIFVMLGLELRQVIQRTPGLGLRDALFDVVLLTTTLLLLRAGWVAASLAIARRRSGRVADASGWMHVMLATVCGVRGSLSLTAALSLPLTMPDALPFPSRDTIVLLVGGTIVATLLLHALFTLWAPPQKAATEVDSVDASALWASLRSAIAGSRQGRREFLDRAAALDEVRGGLRRLSSSGQLEERVRMELELEVDQVEMLRRSSFGRSFLTPEWVDGLEQGQPRRNDDLVLGK
jgi:CPA1 family monovalent cation:H+ antiporter